MGILRYVLLLLLTTPSFSQENKDPAEVQSDEKIPSQKTIDAILARINHFRKLAGLKEVTEDKELSRGCQLHADYMRQNLDAIDQSAHTEEIGRPGFSEQGKKAAARSLTSRKWPLADPCKLVDYLIGTLYHRVLLIAPALRTTGVGVARYNNSGYVLVVDVYSLERRQLEIWEPLLFPADGQSDVPIAFGAGVSEWPNPIPAGSTEGGYPITVMIAPHAWQPSDPDFILFEDKEKIECWFSSPDKPALKTWPQKGLYCAIPCRILRPKTTYTATFRCKQIGIEKTPVWTKTWSFTTAAK